MPAEFNLDSTIVGPDSTNFGRCRRILARIQPSVARATFCRIRLDLRQCLAGFDNIRAMSKTGQLRPKSLQSGQLWAKLWRTGG